MQIATKPGIGASGHFCQTIISPVVWALNKQPFPPRGVLPFPIPSRLFLCPPTLALLSQYFFFFLSVPGIMYNSLHWGHLLTSSEYLLASVELEGALVAGCWLTVRGTLPASGSANLGAQSAASASGSREVWRSWWSVLLAQGFSLSRLFASSSSNGTFCSAPIVSLGSNKPSRHLSWRLWHSNCFNGKLVPAQEACCHQSFL